MPQKMKVCLCGPIYAYRFFLADGENNYWNEFGQTWTENFKEATLFDDCDEAEEVMHDLLLRQIPGQLHSFTAPVVVTLKTSEPVDLAAFQAWLNDWAQLWIAASNARGPSPGPGESLVMVQIGWKDLKKGHKNEPNIQNMDDPTAAAE